MRHGNKNNHLGRKDGHRAALMSNLASSLIMHKRINTTVAKAKALRSFVEPLITRAKDDSQHNRRTVFSYLQSKEAVTELFKEVGPKVATRNGGYTRIIRYSLSVNPSPAARRRGDSADMCLIELVDYNELLLNSKSEGKKAKTTRRGRGKTKKAEGTAETSTENAGE
ncbi:MAG: 50S ribosomal protein L17 [Bacteroidia bacterium]|jgi:large subunit ribosomal protein L17|nr:50S ribosomal protein L17 [Bacteroidia bacterium]